MGCKWVNYNLFKEEIIIFNEFLVKTESKNKKIFLIIRKADNTRK